MYETLKQRIKCPELHEKIRSSSEAASYITPGMTIGVSGFTLSGYPKEVAKALAERSHRGEKLELTVYSGASLGDDSNIYGSLAMIHDAEGTEPKTKKKKDAGKSKKA